MMFIFITWSRTFIIVLNKNSENGHLCPLLDLRRKASNILQYNISCKDFGGIDICCQLEKFFFLVCWDFFFFAMCSCWILSLFIDFYWDDHIFLPYVYLSYQLLRRMLKSLMTMNLFISSLFLPIFLLHFFWSKVIRCTHY